jgi:uncharacterized protein (DUF58 family)
MSLVQSLVKINNIQIAAKLVSEQLLLGTHLSQRYGQGVEFEQYRHYQAGDDPKRIDWKLFARSQKYQIQESSAESTFNIHLLLDLSGSMNYEENGISRLQYAKIVLASLAFLGYRQGDPLQLSGLQNGKIVSMVGGLKHHFQRILYALENAKAENPWDFKKSESSVMYSPKKEIIILATDLLQINQEFVDFIKETAKPTKQILIFQILGKRELDLEMEGLLKFKDLETGKILELDPNFIKKDYIKRFNSYLNELDEKLKLENVYLNRVLMDTPISDSIKIGLKNLKWR